VTLSQLTYFLTAIREGSFSAAAEHLHVAQPSLSEQIARLERELGVALFIRSSRGLRLTDAGRRLQPQAEQVLQTAEQARATVEDVKNLAAGTVTFGAFSSAHHYLLSELVADFRAEYPRVRVRMLAHNSTEIARAVREGDLEAGIVALPIDDRGLQLSNDLWQCEVAYFTTDPTLISEPIDIRTVAENPLVPPEADAGNADPTRRQLNERAQRLGLSVVPDVEVESPEAALAIAALGVGGTVAPAPLAKLLGYTAANLGHVPFAEPLIETFAFITRDTKYISPATRTMLTMAAKRIRRLYTEYHTP
jgi:LysR family transcriptional regulator, cyn operon transcriptional activator